MKYRRDIDGLRAVAVMGVVAFHLKTGLTGGFAGVDVFFVISGYLISTNMYADVLAQRWSVLRFYDRRARRILPALFFMLLLASVAAKILLYPAELVDFAKSGVAALLSLSNVYFYVTSDYFSQSAATIPLLHLWSIGIEEQFYLFFPPIAALLLRQSRRLLSFVLIFLFLSSLIASQYMVHSEPIAAFYLLPFRAFELLLGCLLALPGVGKPRRKLDADIVSIIGLIAIIAAYLVLTPTTFFPGFRALIPCLGAAALIWSGQYPGALANKMLSQRFLVWVGLASYSLYLMHWPVFVFTSRLFGDASPVLVGTLQLMGSLALAAISHRWVETPFRKQWPAIPSIKVVAVSLGSLAAALLISSWTIYERGFEGSSDQRLKATLAFLQYDPKPFFRSGECFLSPEQKLSDVDIRRCLPSGAGTPVILWGDSHGAHLYKGLAPLLAKRGYNLGMITASGCPTSMGRDVPLRPLCKQFNSDALTAILDAKPHSVLLASAWDVDPSILGGLDKAIDSLLGAGITVTVIGDSPRYKRSVPLVAADRIRTRNFDRFAGSEEVETAFNIQSDLMVETHINDRGDARFVSQYHIICPANRCPMTLVDGTPVHFDIAHYTEQGSQFIAKELSPYLLNGGADTATTNDHADAKLRRKSSQD